jgi:hypothetical protein
MHEAVTQFLARHLALDPGAFSLQLEPLHGGLESTVARARLRADDVERDIPSRLVVKDLPAHASREADIYEALWMRIEAPPTVRVLGRQAVGSHTYLYLEDVQADSAWPWTHEPVAVEVCRALARVHDAPELPRDLFAWDYDTGLAASATATLRLAHEVRLPSGERPWRRLGDLSRVVQALPALRDELFASGTAVLHGDVHPGNVLVRDEAPGRRIALIDWGRARLGSPLEDVASWLHALGCWEPEARRRHDTLLRAYLDSRATPLRLDAALRRTYWLASASNGLSGAVAYHLAVLGDRASTPSAQYDSWHVLREWQRVMRLAATLLSTTPARCS